VLILAIELKQTNSRKNGCNCCLQVDSGAAKPATNPPGDGKQITYHSPKQAHVCQITGVESPSQALGNIGLYQHLIALDADIGVIATKDFIEERDDDYFSTGENRVWIVTQRRGAIVIQGG
jgi:hypothetical protein